MSLNPRSRSFNGHAVDARRSVVTLDLLVGSVQVVPFQDMLQQVTCTASFCAFLSADAPRSCILLAFHAIPLQAALAVFCFQYISLLPALIQGLRLFGPSRRIPVLWPRLTSHGKLYAAFRLVLLHVREISPGKNDNLHPI